MNLVGVILLAGIMATNAILLIDFAKWARETAGLSLRDALIEAGAIRLRPILMTTFALLTGMISVSLGAGEGGQFRARLGCRGVRRRADVGAADAAGDPDLKGFGTRNTLVVKTTALCVELMCKLRQAANSAPGRGTM